MTGAATHHPAFRHAGHVAWRTIGGETVLVDLRTNTMIGLNEAGGLLWQALEQPADLAGLARVSGMDPDAVGPFLADLHRHGLLEPLDVQPTAEKTTAAPAPSNPSAPALAWTEELRAAVQSCSRFPGQGGICEGQPSS